MTKLKKAFWITVALALVTGVWMTPSTIAQIRAALVRDTDHPTQQPARLSATVILNTGAAFGNVNLAPVPAGKRLVIQTVSVFGYTTDPERITAVWLTVFPQQTYVSLDPQTTEGRLLGAAGPGTFMIAYNRDVNFIYNAGEVPRVEVLAGSTTALKYANIFLHGYYVTL